MMTSEAKNQDYGKGSVSLRVGLSWIMCKRDRYTRMGRIIQGVGCIGVIV